MTDHLPCTDCGCNTPDLVTGAVIYPHRPDLADKPIWLCPCGAYCGCHPGTQDPLGSTAGPETRNARSYVHRVLDPLWRTIPDQYKGKGKLEPHQLRSMMRRRTEKTCNRGAGWIGSSSLHLYRDRAARHCQVTVRDGWRERRRGSPPRFFSIMLAQTQNKKIGDPIRG